MVTPVVLAAGRSTRMGRTKALLPFGEETALSLILRACRDAGTGAPLLVLGDDAEAIRSRVPAGVRICVNDAYAEGGPAASLRVGLDHLPDEATGLLLHPVDFPLVLAATIAALLHHHEETGAPVVVPSRQMHRGHPVLFDRALEPELRSLQPDDPIHRVVRAHAGEVAHVVTEDEGVRMNLDTPEDYRRGLDLWRRRGS